MTYKKCDTFSFSLHPEKDLIPFKIREEMIHEVVFFHRREIVANFICGEPVEK